MKSKVLLIGFILAITLTACGKAEALNVPEDDLVAPTASIPTSKESADCDIEKTDVDIDGRHYEYVKYRIKKSKGVQLLSLRTKDDVLVIPAEIDGHRIKSVGYENDDIEMVIKDREEKKSYWNLSKKHKYKEIVISEGIQEISVLGFVYVAADKVVLPESLAFVGGEAFGYSKIEEVIVKGTATKLECGAFKNSTLRKIELPKNYHGLIEDLCFSNSEIETFHWPAYPDGGERFIKYDAFLNCKNLKEVTFPENMEVIFICNDVFQGCIALDYLVFPATTGKVIFENSAYADNYKQGVDTLVFKGKDTEIIGYQHLAVIKELDDFATVGKIIAPKNSKAIKFAKRAKKYGFFSKDIKREIKKHGGIIGTYEEYPQKDIRLVPMDYEEKK